MSGKYTVRVEAFFEAAHNLRSYRGAAEPLHGHSYKVEAELELAGSGLDADQLAVDFVRAKRELEAVARKLDYTYLNEVPPFDEINPSAENIAGWIHGQLSAVMAGEGAVVVALTVWEGRFNSVTFVPPRPGSGRAQ